MFNEYHKRVVTPIASVTKGPLANEKFVNFEQQLQIPALPPSNLQHCGIIDLEYQLKIT